MQGYKIREKRLAEKTWDTDRIEGRQVYSEMQHEVL